MKNVLETDSVLLEFGMKRVLSSIYLKIETGKIVGLLGRNGSGKTCLMNIIYGSMTCTSKSIRLNEKPFQKAFKYPDRLQYLPQFNFIPDRLRLKDVFSDFALDFQAFQNTFPEFNQKQNTRMRDLSGGQRRLVEVYVIAKSKTDFVLLDEPFSHIMPLHIEKMMEVLQEEKSKKGILVTDHMYQHVIGNSENVYLLKQGQIYPIKNKDDLVAFGYVK